MSYSLMDLLQDVADNAAVDRAGNFLLLAVADYPWLFSAITENLDKPPSAVVAAIAKQNLLIGVMLGSPAPPHVLDFIARLQEWFREKGFE